jgi:hypothetical protein
MGAGKPFPQVPYFPTSIYIKENQKRKMKNMGKTGNEEELGNATTIENSYI